MFAPARIMTLGAVFTPEACTMTMFVALDPNGRLITIENAHRGIACNCTCVSCGESVVARKGLIREHHFAHVSQKKSCYIQRESLLHRYAKEVICDGLGMQLPHLPGVCPNSEDTSSWWDFETVTPEIRQQGFQPDLIAELKDGSRLFIEIAVTSFIDEEKLERIKGAGTPTIELDLSDLLHGSQPIPSEAAKNYILHQPHHKSWIYPEAPTIAQALGMQMQDPRSLADPPRPGRHPRGKSSASSSCRCGYLPELCPAAQLQSAPGHSTRRSPNCSKRGEANLVANITLSTRAGFSIPIGGRRSWQSCTHCIKADHADMKIR